MLDQIPNQNQTKPPVATPAPTAPAPQAPVAAAPRAAAPQAIRHGSPKKGIIVLLVVFLLLIGSSALAYYKEWYMMLPFFQEKEEAIRADLADAMYERLAQLDGADFELTYKMSVGSRDADAEAPEFDNKDDDKLIKADLKLLWGYSENYFRDSATNFNERSFDGFCDDSKINDIEDLINEKDASFSCIDSEEEWAISVKLSEGYYCYDYKGSNFLVKTAIKSSDCLDLEKIEPSPVSKSSELSFLTGDYLVESWMFVEDTIPDDIKAEVKFTGSGFSLSGREEGKQGLPDVAVGLFGSAKLNSATFDLGIEAKAVADDFYYMVSDFPIMDITKGHMDEWIKMSPEGGWVSEIVPEYDEEQKSAVDNFRKFISETQKYNVLSFAQTEQILEIKGKKTVMFDVTVNAENVPAWLEAARKIAIENASDEELPFLDMAKDELTPEEETKLVDGIKKAMKNIKISAGVDVINGDLMMLDMSARFIPPASSEKFADKQFNFVVNLKLSNHNNPPAIMAPEVYVDYEIIEQEELAMSDEQFQDYKQAQRVKSIREELLEYYLKNRKYPANLSEVTRLDVDRVTNKPYTYSVRDNNNYRLVYTMNLDIREPEEEENNIPTYDDWGLNSIMDYDSPEYKLKNVLGYDYLTNSKNHWHDKQNVADRYSPIADQLEESHELVAETAKGKFFDKDVVQTLRQAKIVKDVKNDLKNYRFENNKYPDSILDLKNDISDFSFYSSPPGFICEDMIEGAYCDYSVLDDGQDYEIKINFLMNSSDINSEEISLNSYSYETYFSEGENVFTSQVVVDSDRDGLNDRDEEKYGTDKNNPDTDGDGYMDGEEVASGHDPLVGIEQVSDSDNNYWIRGDIGAAMTIMEYSDYDCPFCQKHHETMLTIMDTYDGQIKWVYRHFPLSFHPDAFNKAHAAECVGELGGNEAFWQFTDKLYVDKPALVDLGNIVEELGYSKDSWQICMDEEKFKSKIDAQIAEGTGAGVRGTPHSIIIYNGVETSMSGALPFEQFKTQIDSLLE